MMCCMNHQSMSEEETDREQPNPIPFPRRKILKRPNWRSNELVSFLELIDEETRNLQISHLQSLNHQWRGAVKFKPDRIEYTTKARVPNGLPSNCYNRDWIASLPHLERSQLTMDKPVEFPKKPVSQEMNVDI